MHLETSVDIKATPADVWKVLMDVERWPTWTESVSKAGRLGAGALAVGAKVRFEQPGLPAQVWDVTALEPEVSFAWSASRGGVTTTAGHRAANNGDGTTRVVLSIDQRGPLAGVVGLLTARLVRKYLAMEAQGLKGRCEA